MAETLIEWSDRVWNCVRGCTRISSGCTRCYAERQAIRMAGPGRPYEGLVRSTPSGPRWTGKVILDITKRSELPDIPEDLRIREYPRQGEGTP